MCLEGTALGEINERMTNTLFCLYMNLKKRKTEQLQNKKTRAHKDRIETVAARDKDWEVDKRCKQLSSYFISFRKIPRIGKTGSCGCSISVCFLIDV